ncbi:MAG: DNA double-strand break repair Rad50 ATPase [Hyphomicrobiales bacterium]|nr:MAG: DNA double-strand break repair Rad50 ATPase [Hyphomicrobiales bacterium]
MRLGRLDLLRYGHFTDRSFDLPAGKSDFHIVFGPNEAGKSTALAAIEDLLFGIPMHSPYNFLHDYADMRIGAVLENGSALLQVLRRKGNKDTLLELDGSPVPGGESVLIPYLAGADRPFFERMFSLDHVRLGDGGRAILEARDDVGQMLFSAGAGIGGLRERLGELAGEADELWGARRAKHRKFYIAEDKLSEAQKALRDLTLTANNWRDLKRTYDDAEQTYSEIDNNIKERTATRNRLSRIRRVFRDVRRKQELDGEFADLGEAAALPDDAAQVVEEAERKDAEAETRIATLQEQLKRAEESLKKLSFDETLILRAEDIRQLHERRIEIRGEKADLPKREAELNAAEEDLRADARELAWTETDIDVLAKRIPSRTEAGVVRQLLNQKGEREADVTNQTHLLQEAQEAHDDLKERLDKSGDPADVSSLAIAIRTVREQGDIHGRVRNAEKAMREAQERAKRRLDVLKPGVRKEKELVDAAVPARAQVQSYRDREEDWKRRVREFKQKIASLQQEKEAATAALERTVRDEQTITPEALDEARRRRDALWALVKIRHVDGKSIPEDQAKEFGEELADLPAAFEPAMASVDQLADQRFDHAEAAGRITEINRIIGDLETRLEQAQESETELVREGEQLKAEWSSMWETAPFDALAAEAMLEWLDAREEVLEAIDGRADAEITLDTCKGEERAGKEQILGELTALGVDVAALENDGLSVIIERAADEQRQHESAAARKDELTEKVQAAAKEVARRKRELQQASEALEQWQGKWEVALDELGLAKDAPPESVSSQIDTIDRMRETTGRIRSLRHDRIDKINRDVTDFEEVVGKLTKELATDSVDQPAEDAVLELEKRLADAERIQGLREKAVEQLEELTTQISGLEDKRRELAASISHLKTAANVETKEALKDAIARSDRQRSLTEEYEKVIEKLQQDGDGKAATELENECKDVLIDEVAADEASILAELEDLQAQQTAAAEERSRAREAFQAIGGDDAAAQAAAAKEEALAEMREVAERYVRVQTSAILLRWAIERYRREKQAPLLKRAGELFQIITGDSFTSLQIAFDDQDNAYLTGERHDGSVVPVSGMSTGTADQLYLALRVAAIEDYLKRAEPLPFVADDLFINFDDDRAAAGFKLLGELSQTTQVLFFTHHQHLVDIAEKTLGASVSLVSLSNESVKAA